MIEKKISTLITICSQNTNRLPPKPESSFKHIQELSKTFIKCILVPADKAANNVTLVCRLHYVKSLMVQELIRRQILIKCL